MTAKAPLQERLNDASPKCANCKHFARVGFHKKAPNAGWASWFSPSPPHDFEPIPSKGACMQPTVVVGAATQLFYVTDLTLCSLWEPKE